MRTTNIFGAFLVGIAMVQGVPLRRDMSSSVSHNRASEHPYDLDSVALRTAIDLNKEPDDGSNMILDTRAKSSSNSKSTGSKSSGKSTGSKSSKSKSTGSKSSGKSTGSKSSGKSTGSKSTGKSTGSQSSGKATGSQSSGKSTGSQSTGSQSTGYQSTGSQSTGSKSSESTAAQDDNGSSTVQGNDDGDIEGQDALNTSTDNTAESSEEDTEQDIQDAPEDDAEEDISDVSDQNTEEDPQYLSEDDTEGLNDDDSDDSGIESAGGDPDETIPEQEISVTNTTSSNFTLKLARTVKDNRKYQRPTYLFLRDAKEQERQRNKYSRDVETDNAVDNDASHEADRDGSKEQSVGGFHEKRAVNLVGIFKSILNKLGDKGADEVTSLASQDNVGEDDSVGENGKTVASIEMATRRSNVD